MMATQRELLCRLGRQLGLWDTLEGKGQRLVLERAHSEHGESEDVPVGINLFHHLIVGRLPEIAGLLVEDDLQVLPFPVKLDPQGFLGHKGNPLLIRSVRYAVRTKASLPASLTTTQRSLSPTSVAK